MFASRNFRLASLFATIVMVVSMVSVDQAEARRGGSFGSRGTRTFQTAPATNTAPNPGAPIQRTMTPTPQQSASPGMTSPRGGFFNGFGGSMLRGVMLGGLFGLLLGQGFGGMAGLFGLLVQGLLIGGAIMLAMRLFRRSSQPAMAGAGGTMNRAGYEPPKQRNPQGGSGLGSGLGGGAPRQRKRANPDELGIKTADFDRFEAMLTEVQTAYGREDYTALRALTTPEMMSYLSEELGENASKGLKNEVSQIKLVQGDLAESWREGNVDYATTAMRYSAIEATRERESGRIVEGDDQTPSEATELWTFARVAGGSWKLSAIQDA